MSNTNKRQRKKNKRFQVDAVNKFNNNKRQVREKEYVLASPPTSLAKTIRLTDRQRDSQFPAGNPMFEGLLEHNHNILNSCMPYIEVVCPMWMVLYY